MVKEIPQLIELVEGGLVELAVELIVSLRNKNNCAKSVVIAINETINKLEVRLNEIPRPPRKKSLSLEERLELLTSNPRADEIRFIHNRLRVLRNNVHSFMKLVSEAKEQGRL